MKKRITSIVITSALVFTLAGNVLAVAEKNPALSGNGEEKATTLAVAQNKVKQPLPIGVDTRIDAKIVLDKNRVALKIFGYDVLYYVKGSNEAVLKKSVGQYVHAEGVVRADSKGEFSVQVAKYELITGKMTGKLEYVDSTHITFSWNGTPYLVGTYYPEGLEKYNGKTIEIIGHDLWQGSYINIVDVIRIVK